MAPPPFSPRKTAAGGEKSKNKPKGFRVGPANAAKDAYLGKGEWIVHPLTDADGFFLVPIAAMRI